MLKKFFAFAFIITGGILLASCGSGKKSGDQISGTVEIDGSSTVYPVSEAVAEEFRNVQPNVRVTVGSSGTGAGFKKFARGETDISDASRSIKDSEKQNLQENNIEYKELTVALDGISVVVNPENDWINSITVDQLKQIWKPDSKVKKWSDINPDWPDEDIHLYGPNTAHGTYDFFTEEIMGESGASRGDFNAVSDYNVAVQGISTDKYALGYFGLAYYEENQSKLKLLPVDDGDGNPVAPSLETVKNGTYKPLSRPLFIYVRKSSAAEPQVQAFVDFYLKNAGKLSKEIGYIPLPESEYTDQLKEFKEFYSNLSQPESAQ